MQDVPKFSLLETVLQPVLPETPLCLHLLDDLLRPLCSLVWPGSLVSDFCQHQPIYAQEEANACLKALIVLTPLQVPGGTREGVNRLPALTFLTGPISF